MRRSLLPFLLCFLASCDHKCDVEVYTIPKPTLDGQGNLPGGHPPIAGSNDAAEVPVTVDSPLLWEVPESWTDKGSERGRLGSFTIPGPGGGADALVMILPGTGGGVLANVNRWRDQMGLAEIDSAALLDTTESVEVLGAKAIVVKLKGAYRGMMGGGEPKEGWMMAGAIALVPQGTLFVKLVGPEETVNDQYDDFKGFLASMKNRP